MGKLVISSYSDFLPLVGKELGTSEYVELTQERIDTFADATIDHQWIHVDRERAKAESPFGQTIAHGYLTLSLLPVMWNQIVEVRNLVRMINYGMDRMRFSQPVLSGQSVCLTAWLEDVRNLRGAVRTAVRFSIDIKETGKKALEGVATFVYYFKE